MSPLAAILTMLSFVVATQADAIDGRLVDARDGTPIAGAAITIAGQRGSVRTDAEGRFHWPMAPLMPAVVVVELPDGRIARPIALATVDASRELTLPVDAALTESVVVIGSAPAIDAAPAAATSAITARDLEMRHPPTLTQALDVVPGVSAVSESQAAVPAIRGLARGRTLILVDGTRATTERRAGANASFLDPGIARTIEVARGPGSVAYGSDAFGGVIAARTRGPDYVKATRLRFAGTAGWGAPEQRGDAEIARGYGSGGVLIGVRARSFDDYEAPAGDVPNSSWRDRGVRVRWEQSAGTAVWSAGWQSDFARDLGRPRSDSNVTLATTPYENSHRLSASYEKRELAGFRNVRIDALAGVSSQRTDQERLATATRPRGIDRADLTSREMQVRLTGERMLGGTRLQVGADVLGRYGLEALDTTLAYDLAGALTSATTTVSIDSARRTNVGVFAEGGGQVTSTLRITAGVRVDGVRNTNEGGFFGDRVVSNGAVAGLVATTLTPSSRMSFTAQVARGFRDPMLSDRFYRGPVGRGFIEGNPDLKSETSLQFDVTGRYMAGPLQLAAAGYHYRITDLVERYAATPTLFLFRNRGRAELQGVELEGQVTLPRGFALAATAEASRGRDEIDHTPLDDIAPPAVSLTVRHSGGARLSSYLRIKAVGSHDEAGPSEVPTASYTPVDAGARWRLTSNLTLLGTMRNLLNEAYQSSAG
ncbi:MAG TPA: TonB-dependent receptor, partial [Vicinamibacterales bacterium]|nr:TonB-dependent receptor [Vicinamibacterales bacterium]